MSLSKWTFTGALAALSLSASAASVYQLAYTEALINSDADQLTDFGTVSSTSTFSGIGLASSGFSTATVAPGEMKVYGKAMASGGPVSHGYASTIAAVNDTITLAIANQPAGAVRVYYSFYLDAKLSTQYSDPTLEDTVLPFATTYWIFNHQVQANTGVNIFHREDAYGPNGIVKPVTELQGYSGPITGRIDLVATLNPGEATSFRVRLEGNARPAGSFGDVEFVGEYDLGNSLYWGSISRVETLAGQQITNFSVSSELGIDYTRNYAPVPEPATTLLFGVGIGALLAMRRLQ